MAAGRITVAAITKARKRRWLRGWMIWAGLIAALGAGAFW